MDSSNQQAHEHHCVYCFDVLIAHLKKQKPPQFQIEKLGSFSAPLFVTWHKFSDELRGCIGTFSSKSIQKNLSEYAIISSQQDSRFEPIQNYELNDLSVSVSFLVNFEQGKDAYDWQIGVHGIIIEFIDERGQNYNGTFLPEVAKEQQWDHDMTLKYLIRKTGLDKVQMKGYQKDWKSAIPSIKLQKYQSSKFQISYQQYQEIKNKN